MPSTAAICHNHEPQQLTLNVHHHENQFCQQCGQNAPNSTEEVRRHSTAFKKQFEVCRTKCIEQWS